MSSQFFKNMFHNVHMPRTSVMPGLKAAAGVKAKHISENSPLFDSAIRPLIEDTFKELKKTGVKSELIKNPKTDTYEINSTLKDGTLLKPIEDVASVTKEEFIDALSGVLEKATRGKQIKSDHKKLALKYKNAATRTKPAMPLIPQQPATMATRITVQQGVRDLGRRFRGDSPSPSKEVSQSSSLGPAVEEGQKSSSSQSLQIHPKILQPYKEMGNPMDFSKNGVDHGTNSRDF